MSSDELPQVSRRRLLGTLAAAGGAAAAAGCTSSPATAGGATAAEHGTPRGSTVRSTSATARSTWNPPTITTRSSPVPMPRTAADVARELHTLLAKARVPQPYVLVGHSLGGLFMLLYARTYPDQVVGVVLVDAFSPKIPAMFGPAWPSYRKLLNYPGVPQGTKPGWEVIDIDRSIAQLNAAPPLRPGLPLMVLSKTNPFVLPPSVVGFTSAQLQRIWNRTRNELPALEPQTPHLIATGSDHYI